MVVLVTYRWIFCYREKISWYKSFMSKKSIILSFPSRLSFPNYCINIYFSLIKYRCSIIIMRACISFLCTIYCLNAIIFILFYLYCLNAVITLHNGVDLNDVHWENYISISFHSEWDMIVVTVFLSLLNQMEFHLVQNREENCHHDHIPLNLNWNGNIVFSVCRYLSLYICPSFCPIWHVYDKCWYVLELVQFLFFRYNQK